MPIFITPEVGIPLPFDVTPEEIEGFRERAKAACESILALIEMGAEVPVTDADSAQAHQAIASEKLVIARADPGVVLKLEALLSDYDHEFLDANRRITNLVTNKLLESTDDPDPKVRLKALEMLGKRKGVNLFSDQVEITVKQKPLNEIEAELSRLLERYMGPVDVVAADVTDVTDITPMPSLSDIDLDEELGLTNLTDEPTEIHAEHP